MPLTYVTYTAPTPDYTIPFPYIDESHINVSLDGVDTSAYTVVGSAVVLDATPDVGTKVKVYRVTPGRSEGDALAIVDFQDGSVLSETDLDKNTQQLLYLAQEANEVGASSLPIDYDGNYSAQNLRIKDLASPVGDQDSVRKDYVDGIALFGGGASIPQSWALTGANFTETGSGTDDYTYTLVSPVPASDSEEQFLLSIGGVLQRPTTDFTVTESSGVYTLTIIDWMDYDESGATAVVNVQNFGVSRSTFEQPFVPADVAAVAVQVKGLVDQEGDLQQWQDSDAVPLARVAEDGDATFVDVTGTGNLSVTGTSALTGDISVNTNKLTIAGATGNTSIAGTLGVTEATTLLGALDVTGTSTFGTGDQVTIDSATGNITATGTLEVAGGYGSSGVTVDSDGDISTNGKIVSDEEIRSKGDTLVRGSDDWGLKSSNLTSYPGQVYMSSAADNKGPVLRWYDPGSTPAVGPSMRMSTGVDGDDPHIYVSEGDNTTDVQIRGVKDPTGNQHAATMKYVDDNHPTVGLNVFAAAEFTITTGSSGAGEITDAAFAAGTKLGFNAISDTTTSVTLSWASGTHNSTAYVPILSTSPSGSSDQSTETLFTSMTRNNTSLVININAVDAVTSMLCCLMLVKA